MSEELERELNDTKASSSSLKKRRIRGACDICKKKKSDSTQMPGNRCSNCIQFSLECTHKEVTKTLGSAKGYVESLEARLEMMEKVINKLLPRIDLNQEIENLTETSIDPISDSYSLPRNDDDFDEEVMQKMHKLQVDLNLHRFFGKSSGYRLIQTALDIRSEYTGEKRNPEKPILSSRRSEFWDIPTWRKPIPELEPEPPGFFFPDTDLISTLVDAYFRQVNDFLPLLHRPSFEKSVADGLHLRDHSFGGTFLLVCALGSRHSEDPRVFITNTNSAHSAGWKWFEQVPLNRRSLASKPSLHEIQNHALSALFLQSTETPQGCWTQLSIALCMAQEIGFHRRTQLKAPTAENEQQKRVFWVLITLHRLHSSFSGRQCVLQDEDFDLDLPIECDDEYWDHPDPSLNFQQPPKKPSTMSSFICYLRLMDILAYIMRFIYPIKKPNLSLGRGLQYSEQQIIIDLDSAMNSWMDSVPNHLRWNPKGEHKVFMKQSATLYATYYHLQILIHKPFIPSFRNPSSIFPSLTICTNAARSCCHVLEVQSRSDLPPPNIQKTAFISAVILLLNMWSGKRSGFAPHPRQDIEDVQKCMDLLKACERRWCSAGRYWDVLTELATAGDLPFSTNSDVSTPSNKRQRDLGNTLDFTVATRPAPVEADPSMCAGIALPLGNIPTPQTGNHESMNFALPMYSNELGRLPLYGQFHFSDSYATPGAVSSFSDPCLNFPTTSSMSQQSPYYDSQTGPGLPLGGVGSIPGIQNLRPDAFLVTQPADIIYDGSSRNSHLGGLGAVQGASPFYQVQFNQPSPLLDSDTLTMWSTAPTGFELDEWGTYIMNVNQMTHNQNTFINRQ